VNLPPVIMSAMGPPSLTEGGQGVFSAEVSDPENDLAGGSLTTPAGAVYAPFTAIAPGQYQLTLSWDQIQAVEPIEFVGQDQRTFVARFFDSAGNTATQTVQVRLNCDSLGAEAGACGGTCTNLGGDASHCGSCSNSCLAAPFPAGTRCMSGGCQFITEIRMGTCNMSCSGMVAGASCSSAAGFSLFAPNDAYPATCDATPYYQGSITLANPPLTGCECEMGNSGLRLGYTPGTTCDATCAAQGATCTSIDFEYNGALSGWTLSCDAPYGVGFDPYSVTGGQTVTVTDGAATINCTCRK
jgi:hypothetical protein